MSESRATWPKHCDKNAKEGSVGRVLRPVPGQGLPLDQGPRVGALNQGQQGAAREGRLLGRLHSEAEQPMREEGALPARRRGVQSQELLSGRRAIYNIHHPQMYYFSPLTF